MRFSIHNVYLVLLWVLFLHVFVPINMVQCFYLRPTSLKPSSQNIRKMAPHLGELSFLKICFFFLFLTKGLHRCDGGLRSAARSLSTINTKSSNRYHPSLCHPYITSQFIPREKAIITRSRFRGNGPNRNYGRKRQKKIYISDKSITTCDNSSCPAHGRGR